MNESVPEENSMVPPSLTELERTEVSNETPAPAETGARGFAFLSGTNAEFVIEGEKIRPKIDQSEVTDVAIGKNPYVLAGGKIYSLLENGVPRYEVDTPSITKIVHDNQEDHLTAVTQEGDLLWYDVSDYPQEIANKSTSVEPGTEVVIASGFGWTFLISEGKCYCYQSGVDEQDVTTIAMDDTSITDAAMVDDVLVLATSAGLHGFDIESFDDIWHKLEIEVTTLSSSAYGTIYGWNDEQLYSISSDGNISSDSGLYQSIHPTVRHEGYCLKGSNQIEVVWGGGSPTIEFESGPVSLREETSTRLQICNPTYRNHELQLTIVGEGLRVAENADSESFAVSDVKCDEPVIEFCITADLDKFDSVQIDGPPVRLADIEASPRVKVLDADSGQQYLSRELEAAPNEADLAVESNLVGITEEGAHVELVAENTGEIPVTIQPENLSNRESTIKPTNSTQWTEQVPYDSENGSKHRITFFPVSDTEDTQTVTVDLEHPRNLCQVDILVNEDGPTCRLKLTNEQEIDIRDRIRIVTKGGTEQLSGEIVIASSDSIQIWTPIEIQKLAPIQVSIESEHGIVPEKSFEIEDYQILNFDRSFEVPPPCEQTIEGVYPSNSPVLEHIELQNVGENTLHRITIAGEKPHTLSRLRAGESQTVSRYLRLPDGDTTLPESEILYKDESVSVPSVDLSVWPDNSIRFGAEIVSNDETAFVIVRLQNSISEPIQLDSLIIGQDEKLINTRHKRIPSDSEQILSWEVESLINSTPEKEHHLVTLLYNRDTDLSNQERVQCLATKSSPLYSNENVVSLDLMKADLPSHGLKFSIDSDVRKLTDQLNVHVEAPHPKYSFTETIEEDTLASTTHHEIIKSMDGPFNIGDRFMISVTGSTRMGEVDERYTFEKRQTGRVGKWKQIDSAVNTDVLDLPEIPISKENLEVTQWKDNKDLNQL